MFYDYFIIKLVIYVNILKNNMALFILINIMRFTIKYKPYNLNKN